MKIFVLAVIIYIIMFNFSEKLKSYNIDSEQVFVAGVDSGGYFATQMQVAFSSIFKAAAIFGSGPYYCAEGNFSTAMGGCSIAPFLINVDELVAKTKEYEKANKIDLISNLKRSKAFVFSGKLDINIAPGVVKKLIEYYNKISDGQMNIYQNFNISAQHGWINDMYGIACNYYLTPYINKCDFDAVKIFLTQFYGKKINDRVAQKRENLIQYDQTEFGSSSIFFKNGYYYVPTSCKNQEKCGLIVSLHGCMQNYAYVNNEFVTHTSLNEYAESNSLIVLYPQSNGDPNACWDWWGMYSDDYATREGKQMKGVINMVKRIFGESKK